LRELVKFVSKLANFLHFLPIIIFYLLPLWQFRAQTY
jgi:hypothetical protein